MRVERSESRTHHVHVHRHAVALEQLSHALWSVFAGPTKKGGMRVCGQTLHTRVAPNGNLLGFAASLAFASVTAVAWIGLVSP